MESPLVELMIRNAEAYTFSKTAQKVGYSEIIHTDRYLLIESPRPITQLSLEVGNKNNNFEKIKLNK